MNRRRRFRICVSLALVLATVLFVAHNSLAQNSDPILSLAVRWAGSAVLVPAAVPNDPSTCLATYFTTVDRSRVTQNLRCKRANYQFDGTTQLQIAAGKITGRWEDKINNLDGIVSGTVKPDGFDIMLTGNFFDAKMTVATPRGQRRFRSTPGRVCQ